MTHNNSQWSLTLGIYLISIGVVLFLVNILGFDFASDFWPTFIMAPGILFLALGLRLPQPWDNLIVVGSMITAVALLLFYQNFFDHWQSWAYAWVLVCPVSIGVGLMLVGKHRGAEQLQKSGREFVRIGLILFGAGAVFFELIIGISGYGLGDFGWPLLFIAAGVALMLRGQLWGRKAAQVATPQTAQDA